MTEITELIQRAVAEDKENRLAMFDHCTFECLVLKLVLSVHVLESLNKNRVCF